MEPTKTRYDHWCKHRSKDGRVCVLYLNHEGKHKENHLNSEWGDDD